MSTQDSQIHSVHTRFKTNLHPPIANLAKFQKGVYYSGIKTRFKTNLHPPTANLTKFQKGVYYSGIKMFNNLPHNIKDLANEITLFQIALKRFFLINSFHNSEEYFNYQR